MNASIFYCKDEATSVTVLEHLAALTDSTEKILLQSLNSAENNMLKVETGLFEQGDNRHVDESNWTIGSSKPVTLADGQVVIVYNKELNKAEPKALNEVKGQAISDYQLTLEKEWISSLKEQYPIVINKQLLNSLAQ
jgi:peptidyl-prolyl cis-trans isomerase SurA